ncbi:peptidase S8/S53 domain-containing protein [Gigaspora rosea]|uniref:Peptidase S8/S53 domain-containing protein n=1 Tax=Gigaspora rosea TaxID=44941 RepID=A0A397VY85_9GLOM|nr:peptidase S8/S53 domain-containing protein [Gigaspora rosea]CAG8685513.1 14129_t:CDS:2 [Gigaspora rosea]
MESVQSTHYDWLTNEQKKCVEKKSEQSVSSINNRNCVKDFSSQDGRFKGYSGWFTKEFVNELMKRNEVDIVEKDQIMSIQYVVPREIQTTAREGLDRIDEAKFPLDGEYTFPDSAGEGVNIFVVDTGIRKTNKDFGGRAKSGGVFCDGCKSDDDENGHGTNCASIAAGTVFGVAKKATLIAVRVLNAKGSGQNSDIINGLSFVLDQHNKSKNKNSVVSMSLGGPQSAALNKAVRELTDAGVHVVVAAGNEGQDACKTSPASEPSAITVGATEDKNDNIADFSNFGKCVGIYAPGRNVKAAGNKNDIDTSILSGTSQATPHVAGAVALIIAQSGNQSPEQMAITLDRLSTKNTVVFKNDNQKNSSKNSFLRVPAP